MPFQVSYSHKATPAGVINFFDAGADQVTVCDTTVSMTATVIGDLTGHTIVWEQISGTAVTWITPLDQLSVSYTTATFDDKVFRFYIDKGAAGEQFDDVNIFGAPTFQYYGGLPDQNCIINFGSGLRCNRPQVEVIHALPTTPISVVECHTSSIPQLRITYPCDESNILIQFVVQERSIAGAWTDEAIIPAPADPDSTLLYPPLNIGSTYRVVAVTLELNSSIASAASNTVYVDGIQGTTFSDSGAAAADPQHFGQGDGKEEYIHVPTYSVNLITLLTCFPDAPDDVYFSHGQGQVSDIAIPTYDVTVLTLAACAPDVPDDVYFSHGQGDEATDIAVPTYTVLDLTGGDIGG